MTPLRKESGQQEVSDNLAEKSLDFDIEKVKEDLKSLETLDYIQKLERNNQNL